MDACPVPYDFYCVSCGLDQKKILMTSLEGISLHVRLPVHVVYDILSRCIMCCFSV